MRLHGVECRLVNQRRDLNGDILAPVIYLRFTPAISYRRLTQLFLHLYALRISEGTLDAMLQRAKPCFDNEVAAILA
jgi:transposase